MNTKITLLFILSCVSVKLFAQDINLQDLVNWKQYAPVVTYAEHLTKADSANITTMCTIGQAYEGMLKYPDALRCYKHCLSMDSTNLDVLNALARISTNLGKATDAERYFRRVLSSDSTNFYANYQLARLYYQLGTYNQAIDTYGKLLIQNEGNPVLWQNIGDCYIRQELYPDACIAYFKAYEMNHENASLAGALVNTMLRMGGDFIDEAISVSDTALCYNPGNHQLLRNKGMALYMRKRFAEADTLYSNLLIDGDSTYLTLKYGGASKYYAGKYMESIDLLELAYEVDSTSVEVCMLLGSALGKTYDRKKAYVLLDKAEEGLQPNPHLINQLRTFRADVYKKDGRWHDATTLYYEAWLNTPERLDFLEEIARIYSVVDVAQYKSTEERQRGLFSNVLYVKEVLKKGGKVESLFFNQALLRSFYEDMFFRNVTEETMLSPDGKKSKISIVDLRSLINHFPEQSEQILEMRAIGAKTSGKNNEAARLFYQAWKIKGTRIELLREMAGLYNFEIAKYKKPEELQQAVFAKASYVKELIKNKTDLSNQEFTRYFFETLYADMTDKNSTEQAMLTPDGETSQLSITELKSMIDQLPPVSDSTREIIKTAKKATSAK